MRSVPESFARKLAQAIQTQANESAPKAVLRLRRAKLPVQTGKYLERTLIQNGAGSSITDCSITVEHSRAGREDGNIWTCMVDGGVCRVFRAKNAIAMSKHAFAELDFGEPAIACSISFDSKTSRKIDGTDEFITEKVPWIFWVSPDGALHARLWGANQDTVLFSSNVVKVSSVRASYSLIDRFNFGLIVFVLLDSGTLMCRQLINSIWYDAETVSFGPSGVVFVDIAAYRTWDYRVGLQGITSSGHVYELFTQYEGIGTRSQEHVGISDVAASGTLISVQYIDVQESEHVEIFDVRGIGGLWTVGVPRITNARNDYVNELAEEFYTGEEDTPIEYN